METCTTCPHPLHCHHIKGCAHVELEIANRLGGEAYRRYCAKNGKTPTNEGEVIFKAGVCVGIQLIMTAAADENHEDQDQQHHRQTSPGTSN